MVETILSRFVLEYEKTKLMYFDIRKNIVTVDDSFFPIGSLFEENYIFYDIIEGEKYYEHPKSMNMNPFVPE